METFLRINGHSIVANQDEKYDMVIKLASGSTSENELSEWLRANTEQIS
jgi:prophage maintenance system killer protein